MRKTQRLAEFLVAACLLPGVIACSGGDDKSDDTFKITPEDSLEIISWWTSGGEADALKALQVEFNAKYSNVAFTNAASSVSTDVRQYIKDRVGSGQPPDSFQAISGADLKSFANAGQMQPIDDLMAELGWTIEGQEFPPAVLDTLRGDDGKLYAVPVNIEFDNGLYYNKALLDEHGVSVPATVDEFLNATCPALQDAGVAPLSVPAAGWVLALVGFEALLPAVHGGQFYNEFFDGNASPADPRMREFLQTFKDVLACSNVADDKVDWNRWDTHGDAVFAGEAAMIVMGDWIKGYLEGETNYKGEQRGSWTSANYGVVEAFGNQGNFTFNSAVFGVPVGALHPNAGKAWLDAVASFEGQLAFNAEKGSIPARNGVQIDQFDEITQASAEAFVEAGQADNKLLPGYASKTSFEFQLDVNPALLVFAVGGERAKELDPTLPAGLETIPAGDIDFMITTLTSAYSKIN